MTIDWIGVQETGGGGQLLPVWLVAVLVGVRSLPFLLWRVTRRLVGAGRDGERREPGRRS